MQFTYFHGPAQDMAYLNSGQALCSLCGAPDRCFALRYATCPGLTDAERETAVGCCTCLRGGRFEFWHDIEVGLLDERGLSKFYNHHRPPPADFPDSALVELRRTPQFVTWQQEIWLTHCDDFMAYLGTWEPRDFYEHAAAGDGRSLFMEMTDADLQLLWDTSLPAGGQRLETWHATYYVFRCLHCGKLRGNWDCD
jgi:uncharacterized protein CbrC (UPF0167 family)